MQMKRLGALIGLVWLALVSGGLYAAELPPLMSIDDIRPGMKGVGKTVFSGTTIEEFDVEILAVLKNETPGGDAIMAKVSGGSIQLEKVGVIGGMSGSPIYIDGKLIGALAYAYIFAREPMIAGITPIHEMINDAERGASEVQTTAGSLGSLVFPPESVDTFPQPWNLRPIQTPLMVSGADPRLLAFMQEHLAPYHIMPMQGGTVIQGVDLERAPDLEPGAALGVQVVRGDMNMTAVGTVTYRDEEKILGFGHPLLWGGDVNLPMTPGYVHFILSNQISPFKVSSLFESVGAITQDRRSGISGKLGLTPAMVPLTVTVDDELEATPAQRYAYEVIDHPMYMPMFMGFAGLESMLTAESLIGETTVKTRIIVALRDYPPLMMENITTGFQDHLSPIFQAFVPMTFVLNNAFTPVAVDAVSLDITVSHAIQQAEIVGVRVPNNVVCPGEVVEAEILLRPYGQDVIAVTEEFTIPENLQQERIQLLVCDMKFTNALEAARAPGTFQPQNLEQLIALVNRQVSQDHIALSLLQLRPGIVAQGRELPSPPLSMMSLMGTTKRHAGKTSLSRGSILLRKDIPTQYVTSGCAMLELIVNHSGERLENAVIGTVQPIQGETLP